MLPTSDHFLRLRPKWTNIQGSLASYRTDVLNIYCTPTLQLKHRNGPSKIIVGVTNLYLHYFPIFKFAIVDDKFLINDEYCLEFHCSIGNNISYFHVLSILCEYFINPVRRCIVVQLFFESSLSYVPVMIKSDTAMYHR